MDEKTKQLVKERFDALPKAVQDAILSSDYENSLIEIGKQHQLNVEKMGILEVETTLVMMGLTPTKDFETELTRELGVEKEKGAQITKDLNEKVFLKIRDLLKLMNTPVGEDPHLEEKGEETHSDAQVLGSAGIKIINGKENLPIPEKLELSGNPAIHPIFAQKLSSSVQTATVKTEHTLENITKAPAPASIPPTTNAPARDPYREIPE